MNDNIRLVTTTLKLYEKTSPITSSITLKQYDTTALQFHVLSRDSTPFTIEKAILLVTRVKDNLLVIQQAELTHEGNILTINPLDPRVVELAGNLCFEIRFVDSSDGEDKVISSFIFSGTVAPALVNGQAEAPPISEMSKMLASVLNTPYVDPNTLTWRQWSNDEQAFVDTGVSAQGESNKVDTAFDVNSNNAIANTTVTAKFVDVNTDINDINTAIRDGVTDVNQLRTDTDTNTTAISDLETDITAIDGRVTTLEQSGVGGSVTVDTTLDINSNNAIANNAVAAKFIDIDGILQDFADRITALERNSTDMLITTTETADTLTIQQNPNDTSFYAMTIYGKTTQIGTPSPDNPAPIVGVTNPVITVSDGIKTQSITLDGITLHSIDAADLIDTIEIDNGKVTLTHRVAVMTDLNLFSAYASGTTATHTSIYIPTNEYLLGASNIYCNLLPNTDIGGNGYITTAIAQNRIFINSIPNALTGINGGDTANNKVAALKTWLIARGIKILYVPKAATITDITDLPIGQALLGLHGYKGTTVIQFGNGATGNITYNRSANATIAEVNAALTALLGGQNT